MNSLVEVAGCLRLGKKALICGHTMPDGDSVGSVLAMSLLLKAIGVKTHVVSTDKVPVMYDFLPGSGEFGGIENLPGDCDMAVILDCTDLNRMEPGLAAAVKKIPLVVNVDHHISNQDFGTCNYVDAEAAATGEIVYQLMVEMGIALTADIAVNLYTAIAMDTGSFKFDNTTARTHNITAELIKAGIDVAHINRNLFEKKEMVHLKLLGYALTQMKTAAGGRVAWITVPIDIMHQMGAHDEHADGIINYPRMLDGVEVGLLFREIGPGRFKVGFRSKNTIDVNKLAAGFGGGGHPRAAGCTVEGSQAEVEKRVVDLCVQALT